jgi:V8-like Glu-specific endopeptidase
MTGGLDAFLRVRIVDFWTAERRASAKPRDIVLPLGAKAQPRAKPGSGSSGDVLGASWTAGGSVSVTTGKAFFTSGGGRYVCSGSLVDSSHGNLVLTAGHCAHDGGPGGSYVRDWVFYPRYNSGPDAVLGAWTASKLVATNDWQTRANAFENDVAFAVVGNPNFSSLEAAAASEGGTTPAIAFTHPADGTTIHSFGYPAARPYTGASLIYCSGGVTTGYDGRQTLSIPCNMTGGSSGGPWFRDFSTTTATGTLNSVNSYGYNSIKNRMFGPIFDAQEQAAYNLVK